MVFFSFRPFDGRKKRLFVYFLFDLRFFVKASTQDRMAAPPSVPPIIELLQPAVVSVDSFSEEEPEEEFPDEFPDEFSSAFLSHFA